MSSGSCLTLDKPLATLETRSTSRWAHHDTKFGPIYMLCTPACWLDGSRRSSDLSSTHTHTHSPLSLLATAPFLHCTMAGEDRNSGEAVVMRLFSEQIT